MKKVIFSLALALGFVGLSQAGGKSGQGWMADTVSVSSATIFTGHGFLKKIVLSTGTTAGDWAMAVDTAVAGQISYSYGLFSSSAMVTPYLVFGTTTTQSTGGVPANNSWSAGDGEHDYVEIYNGLFLMKSAAGSGGSNNATVYWSR